MSSPLHHARALLDAIRADPDDDGARLVLADWLRDRGEKDRAELIQCQVTSAGLDPWDPDAVAPRALSRRLCRHWAEQWTHQEPLPAGLEWGRHCFRRGLPAHVVATRFDDLARLSDVGLPVEHVSTPVPEPTGAPATVPPWPSLRELSVVDPQAQRSGLERLAAWPGLASVRTLHVELPSIEGGLRTLLESPHLSGLTALQVVGPLDGLADWRGLAGLRRLAGHVPGDLSVLLRSPHLTELEQLTLKGLASASRADLASAGLPGDLALKRFELRECELDRAVVDALVQSPALSGVKWLGLYQVGMRAKVAARLAKAPWLEGVQVLELAHSHDPLPIVAAVAQGGAPNLHTLGLREALLRAFAPHLDPLNDVLTGPASDMLQQLDVSLNRLPDSLAETLAGSQHLDRLQVLYANGTFDSIGARALVRGSRVGRQLVELDLG